jgi:secreted trypsin-like serine protease
MKLISSIKALVVTPALLLAAFAAHATPQTAPIIDGTKVPATDYPTVARLDLNGSLCTGTLIASKYVLSAAHCFFDDRNRQVTDYGAMQVVVNNVAYGVQNVTVHPSYISRSAACVDGETDASVVELTSAPGITPSDLSRAPAVVGTSLLLVGFGTQGTGQSGENGSVPEDGFVNFGTTTVESVPSNLYVEWNFDNGESNTASGDSGGPAFADINGARVVHSITCGGTGNAGFNTSSTNTRVDTIAPWIDSITGSSAPNTAPTLLGLSSKTTGVGKAFSYTAQASGTATIEYAFTNLPDGLSAVGATISGSPTTAGTYTVVVTATNAIGSASGNLTIVVTPFDPGTGLTLRKVVVDLEDDETDLVTLSGTMSVTRGLSVRGKVFGLQIGGIADSFKLNANGNARRRGGFDFVNLNGRISRGKINANSVRFQVGLGDKEELLDKLFALFPEDPTALGSDFRVNLPVEITFNGASLTTTIPLRYNASRGRWVNE